MKVEVLLLYESMIRFYVTLRRVSPTQPHKIPAAIKSNQELCKERNNLDKVAMFRAANLPKPEVKTGRSIPAKDVEASSRRR
ncbi:hypothetical protein MCOR14_007644 [Pyricularia oryzae]|uniref:Uncharacterized protein n=1 Tax=Pyricularia oryzae TaxID=318829 RepID=A0A4P7MZP0_PYROR|nr:hypothetical protein MCOR14_007644 [Pyricularia oryzae]QBZ54542.1 hypothetical protein PoMZ_10242 [Pyricularia oryzae]